MVNSKEIDKLFTQLIDACNIPFGPWVDRALLDRIEQLPLKQRKEFAKRTVDGQWPLLFYACYQGKYEVVALLIEKCQAEMSPYSGLTCLMASVLCEMFSELVLVTNLSEYLLKKGADVNAQDFSLKTALHHAIYNDLEMTTQLFLKYGADPYIKDANGDDALTTASLNGHEDIFQHLIDNVVYSPERIADAYQLFATVYLEDEITMQCAIKYLRKALKFRAKHNLVKHCTVTRNAAFQNAIEFSTEKDLDSLQADDLRMQCLLISERILGATHKVTIERIDKQGKAYGKACQYRPMLNICKYELALMIRKDGLLYKMDFTVEGLIGFLVRMFFVHNFAFVRHITSDELHYDDFYETIKLIVGQLSSCQVQLQVKPTFKEQQDRFDSILKSLVNLIYFLNKNSLTPEQITKSRILLQRIWGICPRTSDGDTLLHLAVSKITIMNNRHGFFPSPVVANLLLDVGFFVDLVNSRQETPLHLAATSGNFNADIVQLLLSKGAHLDQSDLSGRQPYKQLQSFPGAHLDLILQCRPLKCLAACAVKRYKLSFQGAVTGQLVKFINKH